MSGYLTPPEWTERALCAQVGPDFWYPEKAVSGSMAATAKKVCTTCAVREQCLAWALENDERFGIWGGLTERERRKLPRGRRCNHCDEIFAPSDPRERMCSEECRDAARHRTIEDNEKAYGCIQCGTPTTSLRCGDCSHRYRISLIQPRQAQRKVAA